MNLWVVFLTGLTIGGLTCMAVQGGLLAATIAQREDDELKGEVSKTGNALPILSFLFAKLVVYTFLGALLGWLGSFFNLSITTQILLQLAVIIFMICTALNLLNVHPIFRYFAIQPPKFLFRLVRNRTKSKALFTPAFVGALTVFIPCGTTQAMMALAVASGSPVTGGLILFAFVLGTSPLFFLLGFVATKLGDVFQKNFAKVAAGGLILLSLFNLSNVFSLSGLDSTFKSAWREFYCTVSICEGSILLGGRGVVDTPVDQATIVIEQRGYTPNNLTVKAGSDITLSLVNESGSGCTQSFTIPKLGIQKIIPLGNSDTVKFTAPNQEGKLAFMCGMGMFRGVINVI